MEELEARGIEPYIATGRDRHHQSWQERFAQELAPPPEDASLIVKPALSVAEGMAYKLKTEIGKLI